MGVIGGKIGYSILKSLFPRRPRRTDSEAARHADLAVESLKANAKLEHLLGPGIMGTARNKTVVDFGCGTGIQVIQLALGGAQKAIGLDIREEVLEVGRALAVKSGVSDRCEFVQSFDGKADVIVSVDSFEHFEDPAAILKVMSGMLADDGSNSFFRANLVPSAGWPLL